MKPLDLAQLRRQETDGIFERIEIPSLLMRAVRRKLTGSLKLVQGGTVRMIGFAEGSPSVAASSLADERLGPLLQARGALDLDQLAKIDEVMRSEGLQFGAAAMRLGLLSKLELARWLKEQHTHVISQCLGADTIRASMGPLGKLAASRSGLQLLVGIENGIRAYAPELRDSLQQQIEGIHFSVPPGGAEQAEALGCSPSLAQLLRMHGSESRTFQDYIASSEDDDPVVPALTLILTGIAVAEGLGLETGAQAPARDVQPDAQSDMQSHNATAVDAGAAGAEGAAGDRAQAPAEASAVPALPALPAVPPPPEVQQPQAAAPAADALKPLASVDDLEALLKAKKHPTHPTPRHKPEGLDSFLNAPASGAAALPPAPAAAAPATPAAAPPTTAAGDRNRALDGLFDTPLTPAPEPASMAPATPAAGPVSAAAAAPAPGWAAAAGHPYAPPAPAAPPAPVIGSIPAAGLGQSPLAAPPAMHAALLQQPPAGSYPAGPPLAAMPPQPGAPESAYAVIPKELLAAVGRGQRQSRGGLYVLAALLLIVSGAAGGASMVWVLRAPLGFVHVAGLTITRTAAETKPAPSDKGVATTALAAAAVATPTAPAAGTAEPEGGRVASAIEAPKPEGVAATAVGEGADGGGRSGVEGKATDKPDKGTKGTTPGKAGAAAGGRRGESGKADSTKAETPKAETTKAEGAKAESPKAEAAKDEGTKSDTPKPEKAESPKPKPKPAEAAGAGAGGGAGGGGSEATARLAAVRQLLQQHDYRKVLTVCGEILAADPRNAMAYRSLGIAYSGLGAAPQACESYRRYLRFAPNAPDRLQVETLLGSCK